MQRKPAWAVVRLLSVFALAAAVVAPARAQVATVSAKPLRGWIEDVKAIAKVAVPPELAGPIVQGLDGVTGPDGLEGLDFDRGWGAAGDLPGPNGPQLAVVYLPVTDGRKFLASLKKMGLGVDEQPTSKTFTHTITLPDGMTNLYVYPTDGYLFVTPFPTPTERLKLIRPALVDASRPKDSELTVSLRLDKLPKEGVDQFVKGFEANIAAQQDREPGENDAHFEGRMLGQNGGKALLLALVNDARELALDLDLDPKAGPIGLTLRLDAKPGSPTAAAFDAFGASKSIFRGLGNDAVMDLYGVVPLPKMVRDVTPKLIQIARKDAEAKMKNVSPKEAKAARQTFAILERLLSAPSLDLAVSIQGPYGAEKAQTNVVVFGLKVDDAAQLEKLLRTSDGGADVVFDAAKSRDGKVAIHRAKVPQAADRETDRFLGRMVAHFGFTRNVVLVAVGEESLKALQDSLEAIDRPGATASAPIQSRIKFSKIMAFADTPREQKAGGEAAKAAFGTGKSDKDILSLSIDGGNGRLRVKLGGDVTLVKFLMNLGMSLQSGVND